MLSHARPRLELIGSQPALSARKRRGISVSIRHVSAHGTSARMRRLPSHEGKRPPFQTESVVCLAFRPAPAPAPRARLTAQQAAAPTRSIPPVSPSVPCAALARFSVPGLACPAVNLFGPPKRGCRTGGVARRGRGWRRAGTAAGADGRIPPLEHASALRWSGGRWGRVRRLFGPGPGLGWLLLIRNRVLKVGGSFGWPNGGRGGLAIRNKGGLG